MQQNKRLFSPGPHSIRESGNGWERVLGVTGAVEGGCLDGEKVRTSEPGGGGGGYTQTEEGEVEPAWPRHDPEEAGRRKTSKQEVNADGGGPGESLGNCGHQR